ncbi:hypothetical protein Hena1_02660 [Erwinia phage Hena1]|uniref:Uncharacterized protein n=1 Tax=Erwinia phage Hena1 TaxID=2678601 RepID=A0A6B9JBI0_9CAUD|nr:hypothetical protein HWC84_gp098 [Erwinia phage Hena1]QGZ16416.1 hypothetical protein Hena1_02660 [Erwinia phage Hena1]
MFSLATTDRFNVTTCRTFDLYENAYRVALRGNFKSAKIINTITNKTEFSLSN